MEEEAAPTRRSKSVSPMRGTRLRSMFGMQPTSQRLTAPSYGFGSADRGAAQKVFLTPEHAKACFGANSPGPVYDLKSSIGKQTTSRNSSAPLFSFGTSSRFGRSAKGSISPPGPGAYHDRSSIGQQVDSRLKSPETYGFGSSTRAHQQKVFLGADHAKAQFGSGSPGPSAYNNLSCVGDQPLSRNKTSPKWVFGSQNRFKYDFVDRAAHLPGAGQYNIDGSVGKQADSKKSTLPIYSFGSAERDQRAKVYISSDHEKSRYGECSPGPAAIEPKSALGSQVSSRSPSSPKWGFGTQRRFLYEDEAKVNPGPGTYDV